MRTLERRTLAPRGRHARAAAAGAALIALLTSAGAAAGAGFHDVNAGLPAVDECSVAWGDYDNDGDLDILLTGRAYLPTGIAATIVFRSSGGSDPAFSEALQLPGVSLASAIWGDYDNDGDLDILAAGNLDSGCGQSWVYRNNGGADPTFSWVPTGLPGVYDASAEWGDYDNDGDLDLLLTGSLNQFFNTTAVFRNDGGASPPFTDIGAGLPPAETGAGTWGDYDADGDLDILLVGSTADGVYRNDGGTFNAQGDPIGGGTNSSAAWGDYDADGDLDILVTAYAGGYTGAAVIEYVQNQFASYFTDHATLTGVQNGAGIWADYDNDGDLDAFVMGSDFYDATIARLYRNDPPFEQFNDSGLSIQGAGTDYSRGAAAWGDYDNDGDLDLLIAGIAFNPYVQFTRIYRNDEATTPNTPPSAPTNLASSFGAAKSAGTLATFSWDAATDAQTPAAGLTYNLRVGSAPGADDVVSAMADPSTGLRRVPAAGNAGHRLSWDIELPGSGPYYWSVQAIDGTFAGSAFAPEEAAGGANGVAAVGAATVERMWSHSPNPFSRATTIRFSQEAPGPVQLLIYDVAGRRVRTLDDRTLPAGQYARIWDGRNEEGRPVPSGVYFARLKTRTATESGKLVLAR